MHYYNISVSEAYCKHREMWAALWKVNMSTFTVTITNEQKWTSDKTSNARYSEGNDLSLHGNKHENLSVDNHIKKKQV